MTTSYEKIYSSFLSKITDYNLAQFEVGDLEEQLYEYMISSIPEFKRCKKDLSDRDEEAKVFNNKLSDEEIKILAHLMIMEWLSPKIKTLNNLKQFMGTKDFSMSSQANFLKELIHLKRDQQADIDKMLVNYSYSENKLDDLIK